MVDNKIIYPMVAPVEKLDEQSDYVKDCSVFERDLRKHSNKMKDFDSFFREALRLYMEGHK